MINISEEFARGRERPANYIQICKNLSDSYPAIYHGIQKDAIQNAMDARRGRVGVHVEFILFENRSGRFLTIADSNTCGLTGPVLNPDEVREDLPENYHWARFESFAFTKDSPDAIGARGQGKFIFLNASQQYMMFYDSLREDGSYRVGATKATHTGCPMLPAEGQEPWEGERGEDILRTQLGLGSLQNVGTRVIIIDPIDEVLSAIETGAFEEAIKETWFRAIQKSRLSVSLIVWSASREVLMPSHFPWFRPKSETTKTWILGEDFKNDKIKLPDGSTYRVKNFRVEYDKDDVLTEDTQGVAIIQSGMKICSIRSNFLPYDVCERLAGYIEFDRELDRELRKGKNQEPSHYNLRWRASVPRAIKNYVERELTEFGKRKLGVIRDERQVRRQRQRSAEEWAMRQLQKFAKELDLFGTKGSRRSSGNAGPSPSKLIGVKINNFSFPNPEIAPRVNWDETFEDISITCFNETAALRKIAANLHVLWADKVLLEVIVMKRFELPPGANIQSRSANVNIDKHIFIEPGEYRLKARLFDPDTGDRIDEQTRRFWVERDPPFKAPFNLEAASSFPGQHARRQWLAEGSINNSPTVLYNTSHPMHLSIENDEDAQRDYLLQICLEGALFFVLDRPNKEDDHADYHPLDAARILGSRGEVEKEGIPARAYDEIVRYMSDFRWRVGEAS